MTVRIMLIALLGGTLAVAAAPAPSARAESDVQAEHTDETISKTVKDLDNTKRSQEKVRAKQKALDQQHDELELRRRTGAPFKSDQSIRTDLRRNEQKQSWEKREGRRLDYEAQRQQQNLNNQLYDWQRR